MVFIITRAGADGAARAQRCGSVLEAVAVRLRPRPVPARDFPARTAPACHPSAFPPAQSQPRSQVAASRQLWPRCRRGWQFSTVAAPAARAGRSNRSSQARRPSCADIVCGREPPEAKRGAHRAPRQRLFGETGAEEIRVGAIAFLRLSFCRHSFPSRGAIFFLASKFWVLPVLPARIGQAQSAQSGQGARRAMRGAGSIKLF